MKVAIIKNNSVNGTTDIADGLYQRWRQASSPKLNYYKPIIDNIPSYNTRFEYVELSSYTINNDNVVANYAVKKLGFDAIDVAYKTIYITESPTAVIENNNLITKIL